jgi:DNA modification methylase
LSKQKNLFKTKVVPAKPGSGKLFEEKIVANDSPVVCLGQKFENDAARREHFTALLREKLKDPEFRKIEGFPIGEDEDILALSDPPYYTACPNPFIGDLIKHYGKPYDPNLPYSKEPFATDISEGKKDPVYTAHPYHTKVPPKAIARLILHFTSPGDLVLDGFCGSGMVGVACDMCDEPQKHLERFEGQPGHRFAILSDIAPIATSIANVLTGKRIAPCEFQEEADKTASSAESVAGWMYKTKHKEGLEGDILYVVWSVFYECTNCGKSICAYDVLVDRENQCIRRKFNCPDCDKILEKSTLKRVTETFYDSVLQRVSKKNKSVPVLIHYRFNNIRYEKVPDLNDIELLRKIDALEPPPIMPPVKINFRDPPWGDFYRAGYHAGVTHAHHFLTLRNLHGVASLRREAMRSQFPSQMIFVLTGFLDNHSSKRNRYLIDRHHPKGTTCGPLPNSLFIPELQCEVNPFYTWKKTVVKQAKAFAIKGVRSAFVSTEASRLDSLPDNSVDYVFVDPPFGENILYSESSFLWEYCLGVFTNSKNEAIVSRYSHKGLPEYQSNLQNVFNTFYRVLKPGRWITVEFSNRSNAVWNSISATIQLSGFVVADVRVFDKKQGTIRQDMGQSIRKDLIISAYKPNNDLEERFKIEAATEDGVWDFVRTHLKQLPVFVSKDGQAEVIAERLNYMLFDRMVAFHVQRSVTVPLSATEFYAGLEQRFSLRDGMYFLPDQASEYDKKRMTVKEVLQLQLFVNDEVSAIQWLKQQLTKKPQTFQDIHPQFLKKICGWQKHEKGLELSELLKQNFLLYDGNSEVPSQIHCYLSSNFKDLRNLTKDEPALIAKAKDRWYVPDPNKAGDLEKLRERSLLKEFEEYKESKKKLKLFRLEAVRAGFKKCWQERDYTTIISVAEKIPNNVLEEDPKLLMWYDQAVTRSGV